MPHGQHATQGPLAYYPFPLWTHIVQSLLLWLEDVYHSLHKRCDRWQALL